MSEPDVPEGAVGLQLFRIDRRDNLIACEPVKLSGRPEVQRALSLARISGRAEINGDVKDHFADILNEDQDILDTVALDAKSYGALKNRWMKCKVQRP